MNENKEKIKTHTKLQKLTAIYFNQLMDEFTKECSKTLLKVSKVKNPDSTIIDNSQDFEGLTIYIDGLNNNPNKIDFSGIQVNKFMYQSYVAANVYYQIYDENTKLQSLDNKLRIVADMLKSLDMTSDHNEQNSYDTILMNFIRKLEINLNNLNASSKQQFQDNCSIITYILDSISILLHDATSNIKSLIKYGCFSPLKSLEAEANNANNLFPKAVI